jgi:hypothetical protein
MNDSAMLQRKTNPIAAGIPLKIAKNRFFLLEIEQKQTKETKINSPD